MITKTYPRPQAQTYKVEGKVKDNEYTEEFKKEFKELNIPILPLPENYTSDEFMHMLLRESSTWREDLEISYSTSTDCDLGRLDVVPIEPIEEWFQVFCTLDFFVIEVVDLSPSFDSFFFKAGKNPVFKPFGLQKFAFGSASLQVTVSFSKVNQRKGGISLSHIFKHW